MLSQVLVYILSSLLVGGLAEHNHVTCGYKSCPVGKPDMLNVHIISHTHDDVGWLKTVDQYYYGSKPYIQRAGVQYILNSVIGELERNPDRRFIYVETAFFWQWWQDQTPSTKAVVYDLVQSGRLEFIGGGWSMNDEGCAHYNDIVDQMTHGLRKLRSTFGVCGVPRVAWQIDPFGHSREQASLFAQMGFDGLFLGRIDYQDKINRFRTKSMEMIWNASSSLGEKGQLFTGVLYNTYSPPNGFCWDILCSDAPIIDDPKSPDNNVNDRVSDFLVQIREQEPMYATNHIAITMGNDFNYQEAGSWFINIDKLIKYTNQLQSNGSKVNLMYSTPSCYLNALHDTKTMWPTKSDDFFPYSSDPHSFWTGYFTSRPSFKRYVRESNNFLQTCKQLDVFSLASDPKGNRIFEIDTLKESMGIAQHHDAVSGTAKQHVTDDYVYRLYQGEESCRKVIANAFGTLMTIGKESPTFYYCHALNASECEVSESGESYTVTVYNPVPHTVRTAIRLPANQIPDSVLGPNGESIQFQIVPISKGVINLPSRASFSTWELVFLAKIPGLSYQTFFVIKNKNISRKRRNLAAPPKYLRGDLVIENQYVRVVVDHFSGMLQEITNLKEKVTLPISQNFMWYKGMTGFNVIPQDRASGAYIFRPNGTYPVPVAVTAKSKVVQGQLVQEIHQHFSDKVSQVIRLYNNSEHVEFDWVVGPIPVLDEIGKEVITRFDTKLATGGIFYTDANGREVLERRRDIRPTWNLNLSEPIAGNYYPVNSRIYIRDEEKNIQVTLLTDRSVGGSSIEDGSVEIMLHRRLLYDDGFGVGEALNEPGYDGNGLVVRGRTILLLSTIQNSALYHRQVGLRQYLEPTLTFSFLDSSVDDWRKNYKTEFSAIRSALPPNIHILTLERVGANIVILRLEHIFEVNEDKDMSQPANVTLQDLFINFKILSINETTLAANQLLSEHQPLKWNMNMNAIDSNSADFQHEKNSKSVSVDAAITLNPMEIKTFIITVKAT